MSVPNVALLVAQHAGDNLEELKARRARLVTEFVKISDRIALVESLALLAEASQPALVPGAVIDLAERARLAGA